MSDDLKFDDVGNDHSLIAVKQVSGADEGRSGQDGSFHAIPGGMRSEGFNQGAGGGLELDLGDFLGRPDEASDVSEISGDDSKTIDGKKVGLGLLGVLLAFIAVVDYTGDGEGVMENLDQFFGGFLSDEGDEWEQESIVPAPRKKKNIAKKRVPAVDPLAQRDANPDYELKEEMFENPYWYVPNDLKPHPTPLNGRMSGTDEELYRNGIGHEYVYQAFKTVQTIRKARLKGAEIVLYDAISHKRFWTKMEALITLAEYGFEVNIDTVESVIDGVRTSLIKNYFKRYLKKASPGALYVLKQCVRIVEGPARLMVLKVLSRRRWSNHRDYLAAATLDPSPMIQHWLQTELEEYPLSGMDLKNYRDRVAQEYYDTEKEKSEAGEVVEVLDTSDISDVENVEFFDESAVEVEEVEENFDEGEEEEEENFDDGFEDIGGFEVEGQVAVQEKAPKGVEEKTAPVYEEKDPLGPVDPDLPADEMDF